MKNNNHKNNNHKEKENTNPFGERYPLGRGNHKIQKPVKSPNKKGK